jgi:hypothetical protein
LLKGWASHLGNLKKKNRLILDTVQILMWE